LLQAAGMVTTLIMVFQKKLVMQMGVFHPLAGVAAIQ